MLTTGLREGHIAVIEGNTMGNRHFEGFEVYVLEVL